MIGMQFRKRYLNAIPGMVESIRSGMDTRLEDCVPEEDVEW